MTAQANDVEVLREVIRLADAPHPFYLRKSGREALSRLLAVLEERAGGLPGGWVAVPREPTEEMWVAHWKALRLSPSEIRAWLKSSLRYPGPHESGCVTAYRAMLDAAPSVPVKPRGEHVGTASGEAT